MQNHGYVSSIIICNDCDAIYFQSARRIASVQKGQLNLIYDVQNEAGIHINEAITYGSHPTSDFRLELIIDFCNFMSQ